MPAVESNITHFPATILARSSSADKRTTTGAVAGGIIGTLACLSTIGIIYWFYFRRPRSRYRSRTIDLFGSTEDPKATLFYEANDSKSTIYSTTLPAPPPPVHIPFPAAPPPVHNTTVAMVVATIEPSHGPLAPPLDTSPSYVPNAGAGARVGVGFRSRSPNPLPRFQVTNPDPQRESTHQLRLSRQAELKAQITMLREEINGFKADMKKSSPSSVPATSTCTSPNVVESSDSGQPQIQSENFVGDSCSDLVSSGRHELELRARIEALNERIASLQTQQLPSPWTHSTFLNSPPTYSPGGLSLASRLAFESDTKSRA